MTPEEKHPIVAGLTALIGVGLVLGLLFGAITLVVSHVAGLGGGDDTSAVDSGPSLYLPTPQPTQSTGGTQGGVVGATTPPAPPATTSAPAKQITLQSGSASVGAMARIDLSGVYVGGEGAVLQVQRMGAGGKWQDFPVTADVSGQTFSTYVQTGQAGAQRFRMRDTDTGKVSNVVTVTVR